MKITYDGFLVLFRGQKFFKQSHQVNSNYNLEVIILMRGKIGEPGENLIYIWSFLLFWALLVLSLISPRLKAVGNGLLGFGLENGRIEYSISLSLYRLFLALESIFSEEISF